MRRCGKFWVTRGFVSWCYLLVRKVWDVLAPRQVLTNAKVSEYLRNDQIYKRYITNTLPLP